MVSAVRVQTTGYLSAENAELLLTKAKLEVEADLEYREALAGLKALMRER